MVGTIARTTTEETSTVGFGIFYMMVNIGGFVGPIVAGIVRGWSWKLVFTMSSVWIGINFLWVIFFYKEPTTESDSGRARSLRKVLADLVEVLGNGRFFLTVVVTLLLLMVAGQGWLTFGAAGLVALVWIGFNLAVALLFIRRSRTERGGLLAPGGLLIFSTNFRKFRMDGDSLGGLDLQDITRETIPKDFQRDPRVHSCWEIRPKG